MTPLHVNTFGQQNESNWKETDWNFIFNQSKGMIFFLYFEQALLSHLYGTERRLKKINFLKFKMFPKKELWYFWRECLFLHISDQVCDAES